LLGSNGGPKKSCKLRIVWLSSRTGEACDKGGLGQSEESGEPTVFWTDLIGERSSSSSDEYMYPGLRFGRGGAALFGLLPLPFAIALAGIVQRPGFKLWTRSFHS
jgi:hypothetical protein